MKEELKPTEKFRYAEKCLYDYKRNIACLKVLQEDLRVERAGCDVHAQNYQYAINFTGDPSNPVQARVMRIEMLEERIRQLERVTKPITLLMENLKAPEVLNGSDNEILSEILRLMYFGKNPPDVIISELKIARRTFFNSLRELVFTAISYLGI